MPPARTGPPRPFDIDDAKGLVELLCRRLGAPAPAFTPIDRRPEPPSGPSRAGRRRRPTRRARSARSIRCSSKRSTCAPSGSSSANSRSPGWRAASPQRYRVAAPSRQPTVERDIAVVVPDGRPAADVESAIRRHGGPLLRGVTPVRHLSRQAPRRGRQEPGLPAADPGRRPDADRGGARRGRRRGHGRRHGRCRSTFPDLIAAPRTSRRHRTRRPPDGGAIGLRPPCGLRWPLLTLRRPRRRRGQH